ncbi:hypothetical protein [Sphaerisporangium sp. NBC_01403]|uniref:hypothetical protein n=1 Tax=Sphaerisporangium sp. NBC_01403 TaxID=2903599 RepID=UPI003869734F
MEYVAGLVKVPATELTKYDLPGAKRHRKQIREALGFRPSTLEDEEQLTAWLAAGCAQSSWWRTGSGPCPRRLIPVRRPAPPTGRHRSPVMPAEQYGRWISAADTADFGQDGSPAAALALACALRVLNEVSRTGARLDEGQASALLSPVRRCRLRPSPGPPRGRLPVSRPRACRCHGPAVR